MNGRKWAYLAPSAMAVLIGASGFSVALAQEDEADDSEREVIVVTAQKREEDLQTVPISIKVIDAEELESTLADGLEDISRLVPSLAISSLSRGGSQVQIRGLGSNVGNVGTVALYTDGIISAGRSQSTGTFAERDSGLYDVEAVEVLRGPQGTLWGEGSFGGVINIRSRRPNYEDFQASFSGTWSTIKDGSSSNFDLGGMVNVPVVAGKFAVRGVVYRFDRDGYIDGVNLTPLFFGLPVEFLGEDLNTEEITGGRVLASFQPSDRVEIIAIYKHEDANIGLNNTISPNLIAGFTDLDPALTRATFASDFGTNSNTDEGILEINIETPIGVITSVTGYGSIYTENAAPAIFESESWSEELRISSAFDGPVNYTAGFYFRDVERDIQFSGAPFLAESQRQWSIFGQAYWDFAPGFTATVGLRYEQQDVETSDLFFTGLTSEGDFDSVIPKFAIDWQASDSTLVYVSAAKGFRAGGTNTDQSLGTDANFVQAFDPDTIWNYEIGAKTTLLDGKVVFNGALFYIDWKNVQIDRAITSVIIPPTQFIVVNGDDAHSFGLEADVFISPTEDLDIVIGGSIIDAEFDNGTIDSATLGLGIPLEGQRFSGTPKYVFNASVEKRFFFRSVEPFVRADVSARGSSFADVPNTAPPGGNFASDEYVLVNMRGGVRGEFWEIQVFGTNLSNKPASTFSFFDGGFGDSRSIIQPRTFGVNVKLRYN